VAAPGPLLKVNDNHLSDQHVPQISILLDRALLRRKNHKLRSRRVSILLEGGDQNFTISNKFSFLDVFTYFCAKTVSLQIIISYSINRYYEYQAKDFKHLEENKRTARAINFALNILSGCLILSTSYFLGHIWTDVFVKNYNVPEWIPITIAY